jgi:hypothetical protein
MGIEGMAFEHMLGDVCTIGDHGVDHEGGRILGVDREID